MTHRRDLEHHRHSLAEIRDIMNSIKTLAYMETRKLSRFLDAQHTVVNSIEDVAADFLSFHPEALPEVKTTSAVYLLIGTERGFCGDFNHALLKHLEAQPSDSAMLISIGRKLSALLEDDARVVASIDGASVVEEVTSLLDKAVNELTPLQHEYGALAVFCLYQDEKDGIVMRQLLPSFQGLLSLPPRFPHPPILNLPPAVFLAELADHYLFAALHEILYTSLMIENRRRVAHLEGAVKHLDDKSAVLARQSNALRQEDIIEEIEVILLSSGGFKRDVAGAQDALKDNE